MATVTAFTASILLAGCSGGDDKDNGGPVEKIAGACVPDESAPVTPGRCTTDPNNTSIPQCNRWFKVEIPGTICSDGSQYKFFVNFSDKSNNLAVHFEPGGACWDYESCSGEGGIRGAANPNGIADDHILRQYQFLGLLRRTIEQPTKDYNYVWVSYCTGDIHVGNSTVTYKSPDGTKEFVYHHNGHNNVLAVIDWLKQRFPVVPKLLATGCSAGGAGSILNYHFLRAGMGAAAQCGYLLNDSGPIFHSDGPSGELHAKVRASWNSDSVLDSLASSLPVPIEDIKEDFGLINVALSKQYPKDRLSFVSYWMDFNYSLYSYQRFFPGSTEQDIHEMWMEDVQDLMDTYDGLPNMAYFIPYFRADNCSHCVTIPPINNPPVVPRDDGKAVNTPWLGSEIQSSQIDVKGFAEHLLDDAAPLTSYAEEIIPAEAFTPEVSAQCMQGG